MVDTQGIADNVPALSEGDPQHEARDEHQCEDPPRGCVWRPFVQVVLVKLEVRRVISFITTGIYYYYCISGGTIVA